jgi:hypothetical protein
MIRNVVAVHRLREVSCLYGFTRSEPGPTRRTFSHILLSALERATIYSNDPVCADHEPDDRSGDRAIGAECHGCLLYCPVSCEMRNLFLDRNLLVPTMANAQSLLSSSLEAIKSHGVSAAHSAEPLLPLPMTFPT